MSVNETPSLPLSPGDVIADKYRIERVLAKGGMGVVLVAHHAHLDQRVAIKLLLPEAAGSAAAVPRFLREAQAAARIQSEHVCRVFDVGTLPDGSPFMVMELLEGTDLAAELERRGRLPIDEAVGHVVQALDAIVEAHRRGIVHRDLKPSNLFLCRRDDGLVRVKVLDFGISKLEDSSRNDPGFKLTSTQALLGSPAYMSPEAVRSAKDVDARSDVWALGVILYESIAGGQLFNGQTLGEVFSRIREDPVPPLSSVRPEVPADLDRIVTRCLERKREERMATAAELREALLSVLGRLRGSATSSPEASRPSFTGKAAFAETGVAASTSAPTIAESPANPTAPGWTTLPGASRPRSRVWVAAAAALLVGTAGAWTLLARDKPPAAPGLPDPLRPAAAGTDAPATAAPPAVTVVPAETAAPAPCAAPIASATATATAAPVRQPPPAKSGTPRKPPAKAGSSLDDVLGSQH